MREDEKAYSHSYHCGLSVRSDRIHQSAAEGNPYTNVDILPGATVELKLEPNKRYEIGVSLVPAAVADIPVKISVHPN